LAGGVLILASVGFREEKLARFCCRVIIRAAPSIRRKGAVGRVDTRRLSVPATDDGIRAALDAAAALLAGHGLSKAVTWPVEVSLDEVLANVVRHGLEKRGEEAAVEVELRLDAGVDPPLCEIVVADDGEEFDPLSVREPDTSSGVGDRPIGGVGMALVRKLMDEVEYERRDGRNCLRLARRLVPME
jgi:serine/threonine-protein kinase RsbW